MKLPPAVLARNARAVGGLTKEALLAMRLSHPNVVTLRAFEESGEGVLLVMDYVEGRTLEDVLAERGTLPAEEVERIFRPLAEALDYAHSEKVVHRDRIVYDGRDHLILEIEHRGARRRGRGPAWLGADTGRAGRTAYAAEGEEASVSSWAPELSLD